MVTEWNAEEYTLVRGMINYVSLQRNMLADETGIIDQTYRMSRGGCCLHYINP